MIAPQHHGRGASALPVPAAQVGVRGAPHAGFQGNPTGNATREPPWVTSLANATRWFGDPSYDPILTVLFKATACEARVPGVCTDPVAGRWLFAGIQNYDDVFVLRVV